MSARLLIQLLIVWLPWPVRRRLLRLLFAYQIDSSAHIGFSLIASRRLKLGAGARIGHLTICRHAEEVSLGKNARIGVLNWIYAVPPNDPTHLTEEADRFAALILDDEAVLTASHIVDCSSTVRLGPYSLVAGHGTQLITHGIDVHENRQQSRPIHIGEYSMVGTGCIILGGATLPSRSVLGAGSVLRTAESEPERLYAGAPAVAVRDLDGGRGFFVRSNGIVR